MVLASGDLLGSRRSCGLLGGQSLSNGFFRILGDVDQFLLGHWDHWDPPQFYSLLQVKVNGYLNKSGPCPVAMSPKEILWPPVTDKENLPKF